MDAPEFRRQLRRRLLDLNRPVLSILTARDAAPVELTGPEIVERGEALAACSKAPEAGVALLLLPHSVELFLLHIGLILTGRLPAILAWPTSRIDPGKYQRNLLHQLRNLPASELLTLPGLAANLAPGIPFPATACQVENGDRLERDLAVPVTVDPAPQAVRSIGASAPADAVFLQFSGGTTGAQKCVVVTASMLESQLQRLAEALEFTSQDRVVSWLPMYHDMGLIACLWFPLRFGAMSMQIGATDWLMDPEILFDLMESYHGTFTWLPNFAFSYLAGQRSRMNRTHRLDNVRAWINCSEPVRLRSTREFSDAFAGWGVRPESLQASYAMAENVFAVTQTALGAEPRTFPRARLRGSASPPGTAFALADEVYVSSGRALEGMRLRIRGDNGELLDDDEPGGIEIHTECLFSGYWGNDGFVTTSMTSDGWYATGDFGFLSDGELYVIGRTKDIVIVGGQNVFPEDTEALVNTVAGIYPGRVVAFGIADARQGTENLVVVAELRGPYDRAVAERLEKDIRALVLSAIGLAPRYVSVVPERWIVKSTAGKISRRETREHFLREKFPEETNHG